MGREHAFFRNSVPSPDAARGDGDIVARCPYHSKRGRGPFQLTMAGELWEIAHMTTLVKADSRGRVPIRGTKSRRQYLVTAENGGWWVMPAPKFTAPEKIESPAGAWELRAATLESFYDKSKAW